MRTLLQFLVGTILLATAAPQVPPPSVTLTWIAGAGATSYTVYRNIQAKVAACPKSPLVAGITGTSYVDSTVSAKQTYYYNVASVNAHGTACSAYEMKCFVKAKIGKAYTCIVTIPKTSSAKH